MKKIAVLIQTYNDERNIKEAILSAKLLTSSIYVADMGSTDGTQKIAKLNGAEIVSVPYFQYVEPARQIAIQKIDAEWIFILDPDERITDKLAKEIKETINSTSFSHFKIPRKNIFAYRKWLQHGGWWPDYQTRFFKKNALIEWPKRIHASPVFSGTCGQLKEPFLHYFHPSLEDMVTKTTNYEVIEAKMLADAGRYVSPKTIIRKFLGELFRRLIKKEGARDGSLGIIESMYQAYSKASTWLYTYELKRQK